MKTVDLKGNNLNKLPTALENSDSTLIWKTNPGLESPF